MTKSIILATFRQENLDKFTSLHKRPANTWIRDIVGYRKADFKLAPLTRFCHLVQKFNVQELADVQQQIDRILAGEMPDDLVDILLSAAKADEVTTADKILGALTFSDGEKVAANDQREDMEELVRHYKGCAFWPNDDNNNISKSEFWSENHILLYLSSAVLFKQRCDQMGIPSGHVTDNEVRILKDYLAGHISMCDHGGAGVYEVLSGTYLPHTMKALLNLYDFSTDPVIRDHSDQILRAIARQFLLVTNASGVCSLTATCRAPHKNDLLMKTHGHHTDDLVKFLLPGPFGNLADAAHISDFGEFLLTSEWNPVLNDPTVLEAWAITNYSGRMNHQLTTIQRAYCTDPAEATPFYCSAGLLMHPDYVENTDHYRERRGLAGAFMDILKLLKNIGIDIRSVSRSIRALTCSQRYCDIDLRVFKTPHRHGVLTSFQDFNEGQLLFQQISWCANVDGASVFTACPLESDEMADFVKKREKSAVSNVPTSILGAVFGLMSQKGKSPPEVAPCVRQRDDVVLIVYALPGDMEVDIKAFWPRSYFTHEEDGDKCDKNIWWVGQRERAGTSTYVGLLCKNKTTTARCKGKHDHPEFDNEARPDTPSVYRIAHANKCVFACVLGDSNQYPSLRAFKEYVHTLEVNTTKTGHSYTGNLTKNGQEFLTATVVTEL